MAQIVKLRRSSVTGNKPTTSQLELGELAMNTYDGKIYFEKSGSAGESIEEILVTNTQNTGSLSVSGSSHNITGDLELSGSLKLPNTVRDYTNSTGSVGQVLQVTENGAVWVDNTASSTGDGRTAKQAFSASTTWTFNHNLNEQYPVIELYDSNNQVIIPSTITATSTSTLTITFAVPVAGTAVATVGGMRGYQGNQGPQGSDGYIGADGAQGPQGAQGDQGFQGFQGPQGDQGIQGAQGDQGFQGAQGDQGYQGIQGAQGDQGFQGAQGDQGITGDQGFQGSQGPQGDQGATGAQGAVSSSARNVNLFTATAGQTTFTVPGGYTLNLVDVFWNGVKQTIGVDYTASNGTTVVLANGAAAGDVIEIDNYLGEIGSQGRQGATGAQGATGDQGAQGTTGSQGNQGPTGFQGNQGPIGPQGSTGAQGNQGPTGQQGNQGPTGLQGSTGAQGNQGPTGAQGNQGPQGDQGPTGPQGATGAQGNQGFQGSTGAQGTAGSLDAVARSGDTMTGQLNGTSAVFSSTLSASNLRSVNSGVDGTFQDAFIGVYSSNSNEQNAIQTSVSSTAAASGFRFQVSNGGGSTGRTNVLDLLRDRAIFSTGVRVAGSVGAVNIFNLYKSDNTTLGGQLAYDSSINQLYLWNNISSGYFSIYTNSAERLKIESNGIITANNAFYAKDNIRVYGAHQFWFNNTFRGQIVNYGAYSGGTDWSPFFTSETSLAFGVGGNATKALNLSSTGVATFSSSVSATSFNANVSSFGTDISVNSTIRVGSAYNTQASIIFGDAGTPYWSVGRPSGSGDFYISSYALTALTIQPTTGNVGIGITSPSERLHVNGNIYIGNQSNQYIRYRTASAWDYYLKSDSDDFVIYDSQSTEFFRAIYNGGGTAKYVQFLNSLRAHNNTNVTVLGTLTENSSIRYKDNVKTIEYGLDKVLQMRGVSYTKKDTGLRELGLIAEEVNEILPDVVLKNSEGEPDSVSYSRITAVLIEAIKDLQQQINVLNSK